MDWWLSRPPTRAGHTCYRTRRTGERKRKSVRGCVVSSELSVLNLVVVKKGDQEIAGLTDQVKPRRHAPKRASAIRKLFVRTYLLPLPPFPPFPPSSSSFAAAANGPAHGTRHRLYSGR